MDIAITRAQPDDVAEILELWRRAETEPSVTDDEDGLRRLLAHDPDALLVARVDDEIVGTVIAAWNGWRGSLYRLAVVPERRRCGIGRTLAREAEQRLRSKGARRIDAIVVASETGATAFWAATGHERQENRARFVKNLS